MDSSENALVLTKVWETALVEIVGSKDLANVRSVWGKQGLRVGLVPTMGALHLGHAELMKEAVQQCDKVIVSVFVNPTQFGPNEDFSTYPRTLEADVKLADLCGVDLVFAPIAAEMYVENAQTLVQNLGLSRLLCGEKRPGHFDGVCTIVTKLLNLCQPSQAFFGKKDYQQLQVVRKMVEDLFMHTRIVGVETVREETGLAMSSRNQFLSPERRSEAQVIYAGLQEMNQAYARGDLGVENLKDLFHSRLSSVDGFVIEYIEIVDRRTLEPYEAVVDEHAVALSAVRVDNVRLIDNLELNR